MCETTINLDSPLYFSKIMVGPKDRTGLETARVNVVQRFGSCLIVSRDLEGSAKSEWRH